MRPAPVILALAIASPAAAQNGELFRQPGTSATPTLPFPHAPMSSPIQFGQNKTSQISGSHSFLGAIPQIEMIWDDELAATVSIAGTVTTWYFTGTRAPPTMVSPTAIPYNLSWFYLYHPDWIEYCNDRATPAYVFGHTNIVPINFTDRAVVSYFPAGVAVDQANGAGVKSAIALDNIDAFNRWGFAGHFAGAVAGCGTADQPSCGGVWHQDFVGNPGSITTSTGCEVTAPPPDPTFTAAMTNYINGLRTLLHAQGYALFPNGPVSGTSTSTTSADEVALASAADGVLAEGYPLAVGKKLSNWDFQYNAIVPLTRGWFYALSYLRTADDQTGGGAMHATNDEISWITANFLLVTQNSVLNFLSAEVDVISPPPGDLGSLQNYNAPSLAGLLPWQPQIGTPLGPPPTDSTSGRCWDMAVMAMTCYRLFSNGVVAVNPDATNPHTIPMPNYPPGTYKDQFGDTVTVVSPGVVTISAGTGMVIIGPPT